MAVTLFDLAYRVAREVGGLSEGTATTGTASTLTDINGLAGLDNDTFNGGTLWILQTTDRGAPEKQFSIISDFVASTKRVSLRSALTAQIGGNDTYAIAKKKHPLNKIVQSINSVLSTLGDFPVEATGTATVADQRIYDLPLGASADFRQVWLHSDPENDVWMPLYNWDMVFTTGSAAEQILIDHDFGDDEMLKFVYIEKHPALRVATDVLNEVIPPDLIVYRAAAEVLSEYMDRTRQRQQQQTMQRLLERAEIAKRNTPQFHKPERMRWKNPWSTGEYWYLDTAES